MTDRFWGPSKPRAVDGGIKARSKRGAISQTWWSGRFIQVLEDIGLGGRLQRGRRYARAGQVIDMTVAPGLVSAQVQGSRPPRPMSSSTWMNRPDHQVCEIAPRLLRALIPPSTERGFDGPQNRSVIGSIHHQIGQSSDLLLIRGLRRQREHLAQLTGRQ